MSAITREEVAHLAKLARLALTDNELDHYAQQLDVIIGAVARVSEAVTPEIPLTSHPIPMTNVFREDVVKPGLTNAQALSGAPAAEDERFRVPRILDES